MVECMECGRAAALVGGERIYPHRPDLYAKNFWLCTCGAYCGCHPGGVTPLGFPCGPETRRARNAAHTAFDPLWTQREMSRASAYAWLSKVTGIPPRDCHIGMMTAAQARGVVQAVHARHTDKKGPNDE